MWSELLKEDDKLAVVETEYYQYYYFTEKKCPANCVKNDKCIIRFRNPAKSVNVEIG